MPQCIYAAYKRVYLSNIIKMRFLAILSTLCNGIPPRLWYTPPMSTEHIDLIKLHQCCTQKIFNLNYCFKLLHLCVPEESKTQTNRNQLGTLEATSEGTATPTTLTSSVDTTSVETIRFYNTADFIHRQSDDRNENPGSSAFHPQRKTTTDTTTTKRKSTSFYIYFLH